MSSCATGRPCTCGPSGPATARRGPGEHAVLLRSGRCRAELDRGQLLYLLARQVDSDVLADARRGSDRDRHLLSPPDVALLEEHMCDVMILRVDDQALHRSDPAVRGVDL